MKIGVLTLVPKSNYGGILQAAALCGYLTSQGHEIVLINKNRFKKPLLARIALGLLERLPFQNIKNKRQEYLKAKRLKPFIDKHLPKKSREIISTHDLENLARDEEFDAVVVGSDQVWRYQYIGDGHHNVFFLDFDVDKAVRKIAYGASFGKGDWEAPEYIADISRLLRKFHAISTREKSGVDLCKSTFGVLGVTSVLDPTMLVGAGFYDRFLGGFNKVASLPTIATYILDQDEEKQEVIDFVSSRLEPIFGVLKQVNLSGQKKRSFYCVSEWLWSIKSSKFIVTDSFHGMVFSIIFEKQFVVIGNSERGLSRFTDLLSEVGLCERLVLGKKISSRLLEEEIDYSAVKIRLAALREKSARFLHDSIEVAK